MLDKLTRLSPSRLAYALASLLLLSACQPTERAEPVMTAHDIDPEEHYRPALQLGELFEVVQMERVFQDSKTFVDSRPRQAPAAIVARYQQIQHQGRFDLARFVGEHFLPPRALDVDFQIDSSLSMEAHLRQHWDYLVRQADEKEGISSLIPLPYPYVVPGGRFREIYYWDSYFTMRGLAASGRDDLITDMIRNFAWMVDQIGHIPNGNRTYYLTRSQPPFFAAMVSLYRARAGDQAAAAFLPQLRREYDFWMAGSDRVRPGEAHRRVVRMEDGCLLNRYYDELDTPRPESYREDVRTALTTEPDARPALYRDIRAAAESGWDFSSRWMNDNENLTSIETTDIVPVDLNSLLYHLERTISELAAHTGAKDTAEQFAAKAAARRAAIDHWLWDESTDTFADYHLLDQDHTPVLSLAMVYPLYFGIATQEQADAVARELEEQFLMPGGLVTTLYDSGEQWDYPNGWAPLQWLAVKGLRDYGHRALSDEVAERWIGLNRRVFRNTGRMMEKYNVVDTTLPAGGGEYPLQDGFGWTNAVVLAIGALKESD